MKLLISLFICIGSFSCLAQDSVQFVFNERIDLNNTYHDGGLKTIYWNNGVLSLGYCNDSASRRGMTLSYFDTLGNVVWNRNYFYPFNDTTHLYGVDLHIINDSSLYVAGIIHSGYINTDNSTINYEQFLARFNAQGDSLFFHFLPGPGRTLPLHFLQTETHGLLLFSQHATDVYSTDFSHPVYRINASETLDTLFEYFSPLKYTYQLFQHDHKFYIGGTRRTSSSSSYHYKVFVDVFDSTFTPVANWNPSTTLNEEFKHLFVWQDHLYISSLVTAYIPGNGNAYYRNQIAGIDAGNYTNAVNFGSFYFFDGYGIPVVISDSLLVISHRQGGLHTLFFVDSTENVRVFHSGHPPYGTLLFYTYDEGRMVSTPDGKLIGTGAFFSNPGEYDDHWIFMTTDLRKYFLESTTGLSELNSQGLNAYPVPFSSELTVCRTEAISATIQLIDLNGKCVLERTIDEKVQKIVTDELPAGNYLLRLTENGITKNASVLKE